MKKLKHIAKITIFSLVTILIIISIILGLISARVKSKLVTYSIPKIDKVVDSTVIHFIHGSIPYENCTYKKARIGGYLGGHIEIEINNKVYGFLYDSIPINFTPKINFNSKFECREKNDWIKFTQNDKITSITIPISIEQKTSLVTLLKMYLKTEPYDYAFIGQRCTSATAEILSDAKILNTFTNNEAVIAFFYPRTLRFEMLKFAKKNDLNVTMKSGINCHKWE